MSNVHETPLSARIGPMAQLLSVLFLVAVATVYVQWRGSPRESELSPPPEVVSKEAAPPQVVVHPAVELDPSADATAAASVSPAAQEPLPAPKLDRVVVARAEASLDAASRDRALADDRVAEAESRLATATRQAALDAANAKKLAFRIRDPSTQINQVAARGAFIRGDLKKIQSELATLRTMPRPKATSILTKSPVARPSMSDEFHFELRRNRISFIDLEHLMDLAKADAQVRIRMTDRSGLINSQVGPAGSFSLVYVLGRSDSGLDELVQRQSIRFDLKGWELVPESDQRGETYEATRNPISLYRRAVNRINHERAVITLWVYPDSFVLYRRIRDELIAGGYSVAGRPLPEGMLIRGSPLGSVSAAQ